GDRWRGPCKLHDVAVCPVHVRLGHDDGCQWNAHRASAAPEHRWIGDRHEDQASHGAKHGAHTATGFHSTATAGSNPDAYATTAGPSPGAHAPTPGSSADAAATGAHSAATGSGAAATRADTAAAGASASVIGAARAGVPVQALSGWERLGLRRRVRHRALSSAAADVGAVGDQTFALVGGFGDRARLESVVHRASRAPDPRPLRRAADVRSEA